MENSSAVSIPPTFVPAPFFAADVARCTQQWKDLGKHQEDKALGLWMSSVIAAESSHKLLIEEVFGNSSYLSRLLLQFPKVMHDFAVRGANPTYDSILNDLTHLPSHEGDTTRLMQLLRFTKGKMALLVALADISGLWSLEQVTLALSELAQQCLTLTLNTLLLSAHRKGEIELPYPETPSQQSGIIVLGMGKLGGVELNYSSDIDLIIFYEPGCLHYKGRLTEQHFMNRVVHDMVAIMQERTRDGYVFRTDIRLRPDPASTPPAITTNAAYYYYESVGQNWERAAMIKARPVAGDLAAGEQFLKGIAPFMWRRNLDFAAINDIHSIKRQMDSHQSKAIQAKGHNIKLGMGGIREIEFYAQIHQLIWGGREAVLRTRATCDTLDKLQVYGLIEPDKKEILCSAYAYLRKLEHRLQMVGDEQTHSLPETDEGIAHIACFMGYADRESFENDLLERLNKVHGIYASSFKSSDSPVSNLGTAGNLVFTGTNHDPDTLKTLSDMGFSSPETVSEIVMGWHHGSRRSTRTKRARELLTELMPALLDNLAKTANPDAAFLKFNEFLLNLPAGVQLFSLFQANPHLLRLIADIMGSAPTLADTLSKTPELLDAVLYEDFYGALPLPTELQQQLDAQLAEIHSPEAHYFEDCMNRLRYFRSEKQFQAGVQLLKQVITSRDAGIYLSHLADVLVRKTLDIVTTEFEKTYGRIAGSRFAIVALGKLGSREMTFSSDIDLVFIYDVPDFDLNSDGDKSFGPSVYYNRLSQRFLNALTAMGRDGRLYEVDTRLRPSGTQGLLSVSTKALTHYFNELAWTFEYMAFTKARVVCADQALQQQLSDFILTQLAKAHDPVKLRQDAADMRERIEKEHDATNLWDIKYVHGGLMDIDFIAQTLLLTHASKGHGAITGSASDIFNWLAKKGHLNTKLAQELIDADRFLSNIFHMLRLCCDRAFVVSTAPSGLKQLLVSSVNETDFASLEKKLIQVERSVRGHYIAQLRPSTS